MKRDFWIVVLSLPLYFAAWWLPCGVAGVLFGRRVLRRTLGQTAETYSAHVVREPGLNEPAPPAVWLQVLRALVVVEFLPLVAVLVIYGAFVEGRRGEEPAAEVRTAPAPKSTPAPPRRIELPFRSNEESYHGKEQVYEL